MRQRREASRCLLVLAAGHPPPQRAPLEPADAVLARLDKVPLEWAP